MDHLRGQTAFCPMMSSITLRAVPFPQDAIYSFVGNYLDFISAKELCQRRFVLTNFLT